MNTGIAFLHRDSGHIIVRNFFVKCGRYEIYAKEKTGIGDGIAVVWVRGGDFECFYMLFYGCSNGFLWGFSRLKTVVFTPCFL